MEQEQNTLLLKDISARLPYNPMVEYKGEIYNVLGITVGRLVLCKPFMSCALNEYPLVEEVKPYLFPLSSMTEEQKKELFIVVLDEQVSISDCSFNDMTGYSEILTNYIIDAIDWFNKNHFDYRGLIPMGLALDATGLNIY